VGLRDVLMDYVKPLVLRLALDVLVTLMLVMSVVWVSMILWSVYG
jgi:succinate dehydrogenase / fumarate reductase membrane anchor subunit